MRYDKITEARFLERPNRFIALVEMSDTVEIEGPFATKNDGVGSNEEIKTRAENDIGECVNKCINECVNENSGQHIETVHVKNTGRCTGLLVKGCRVLLNDSGNPNRKTRYDLVSAYKPQIGWINIDSQAPNKITLEWLENLGYDLIKPEYRYNDSRIDFYMKKGSERFLMEVKGCTLERDGIGYFPDAPTERGVKHLNELSHAISDGFTAMLTFVIQMNDIHVVLPEMGIHPQFGRALLEAMEAGVQVGFLGCKVTENEVAYTEYNIAKISDIRSHVLRAERGEL